MDTPTHIQDIETPERAEEALKRRIAELTRETEELKRSYEALQAAQVRLIEAGKSAAVARLAAGIAHEVKNPLAALMMGVEYLDRHSPRKGEIKRVLQDMQEAIEQANGVLLGLLDFAAPRSVEPRDEQLADIIARALSLVEHERVRARITVVSQLPVGLPPMRLDRNKMVQAFANVFMNAIQAMPRGGTLTVKAVTQAAFDPSLVIHIEDTGTGIPGDALPKIFDPFFTTKSGGKGSGLGLPVTLDIVRLHGGSLAVENRAEGGVRVRMELPLEAALEPAAASRG